MSGIVGTNAGRASGVVGTVDSSVAADAITGDELADDAVDSEHYTDGSIDNAHIADDAIDSEHYADGSIDTAHIADNQITLGKMAGGTDGNIISFDASGDPVAIATGNDGQVLTSTGAGSPPAFEDSAGGVDGITSSADATAITISADEEVSMPLQPCFNGHNGTQNDITGDNTDAVVLCLEVFDQAGNYATNNTFTAPITGKYILCGHVGWAGVLYGTADHVQIQIATSNRNYMLYREFANEIFQEDGMSISVVADLDASDTAQLKWKVGGMAKNADQRNGYIGFSGCLIA